MKTALAKFMSKIPAEYWPKVEQAISHTVKVLYDPTATGAQYDAVSDELQSLHQKVQADSVEATAKALKEAIEEKLKAQWAARLIAEGMEPKQAAKEASKLLTPKINQLLSKVEFFRGVVSSRYFWPSTHWAWLKISAGVMGAAGLLCFAVYSGVQQGNSASGLATDLARRADAAKQAQEFWDRERALEQAMNGLELSGDEFERMADVISPQPVALQPESVARQPQPVGLQPAPPTAAAIPQSIAAQPIAVTITRPNQQPVYTQSTVGTFITAMPSPQREQAAADVIKASANELRVPPPVSNTRRISERHFTIHARDGNGKIFGTYSQ